jgi:hypothetical protein
MFLRLYGILLVMISLSHSARVLLLRGFFIVFAIAGLAGVVQNKMFLHIPIFTLQAAADIAFAGAFVYLAWKLPSLLFDKKNIVLAVLGSATAYVVVANAFSLWLYVQALGLTEAAERTGDTIAMFLASQFVILVLAPVGVSAFLWLVVRTLRTRREQRA